MVLAFLRQPVGSVVGKGCDNAGADELLPRGIAVGIVFKAVLSADRVSLVYRSVFVVVLGS